MTLIVRAAALVLCWGALGAALAQGNSCIVRMPSLQGSYGGDCVAGYASGRGRATGADRYEGGFRDGQPTGYGIYSFADGRRFEGEFLDGRVVGRARFYYANGDVLEGEFRDNQLVGRGRLTPRSGNALLVEMRNGGLVSLGSAQDASPTSAVVTPPGNTAQPTTQEGGVSAVQWAPRMDFEDLFPSYILAASTRKPIATKDAAPAPRGDPLSLASGPDALKGPKALALGGTRSRYMGGQRDAIYIGDQWGLIGIKVRSTEPNSRVSLRVTVDEIADPTEETFVLPTAGTYALYPRLRYRFDKLRAVLQPTPVNVNWAVAINGQTAGNQTQTVRLRSIQDAPFQLTTERGVENMSWVFAGFVTEDAPWIDGLLKEAFAKYGSGPVGYQGGADLVDKQVEIVFDYLRQRGVKYSSITATSGISERVASQIVRFPSDSIRTSQANCVDGTVLMASILRKMGIEPIIITGPGHAMLGYIRTLDLDKPDAYRVLETTMLGGKDTFATALKSGMATYKGWEAKAQDHPSFQVIVVAGMRKEGVLPISR